MTKSPITVFQISPHPSQEPLTQKGYLRHCVGSTTTSRRPPSNHIQKSVGVVFSLFTLRIFLRSRQSIPIPIHFVATIKNLFDRFSFLLGNPTLLFREGEEIDRIDLCFVRFFFFGIFLSFIDQYLLFFTFCLCLIHGVFYCVCVCACV